MSAGSDSNGGQDAPAGESVLVVDDDPFIARLLEIELRAAGYEVRVAGDGERALALVRERCPELVLADVMMPTMDGFELTRRLRQDSHTASVSIIMLTARGLSADKLEGFSIGADDYIVKPFDTPELLARIRGVLRRAKEMRAQSPLTGLPGNVRIEDEIEGRFGPTTRSRSSTSTWTTSRPTTITTGSCAATR
jgi:DNA-binding response OmpR family regulator